MITFHLLWFLYISNMIIDNFIIHESLGRFVFVHLLLKLCFTNCLFLSVCCNAIDAYDSARFLCENYYNTAPECDITCHIG